MPLLLIILTRIILASSSPPASTDSLLLHNHISYIQQKTQPHTLYYIDNYTHIQHRQKTAHRICTLSQINESKFDGNLSHANVTTELVMSNTKGANVRRRKSSLHD